MGDYLFAGGMVLTCGFVGYVAFTIGRGWSRNELRTVAGSRDYWRRQFYAACYEWRAADERAADAEKRAAVDEAEAIVMGRVA